MLYHSMLTHVRTCPTSFHQLYSMMKSAAIVLAQKPSTSSTAARSGYEFVKDA